MLKIKMFLGNPLGAFPDLKGEVTTVEDVEKLYSKAFKMANGRDVILIDAWPTEKPEGSDFNVITYDSISKIKMVLEAYNNNLADYDVIQVLVELEGTDTARDILEDGNYSIIWGNNEEEVAEEYLANYRMINLDDFPAVIRDNLDYRGIYGQMRSEGWVEYFNLGFMINIG